MTDPGLRLHHVPFSRSFRVLWLLSEMGLTPEVIPYTIGDRSLRAPEVLAKTPAGRVPALEIDGITLFESGAILQYLTETRPEHGFGRAPGDPERARFLELIHFAETMASLIEQLNMSHIFLRDPAQASATVIKLTTARLKGTLEALSGLIGGAYLLPSGFSAADAMMGFNLSAAPYYVKLDPWPALVAYRDRVAARPGFQRARDLDGEQRFYSKDFYPVPEA